jgi:periplasmic divalent cation tolerance protein
MPRQPEVPKWIAWLVTGGYCILARGPPAQQIRAAASRKSKGVMTDKIVVLVTCGSAGEARRIARALVEKRLAACGNIVEASVRSIYRWKGRVESAKEFLLVIKSSQKRFAALQSAVKRLHGYDVPEIIALPIVRGSSDYLRWLSDSVSSPRKTKRSRS